jgi:ATP-dependent DNA ligase
MGPSLAVSVTGRRAGSRYPRPTVNRPATFSPMPLERRREPFDHPEWIFELKYDGFRALAFVTGGGTKLVSRRELEYRRFDDLRSEITLEANADDPVLDGEIVKLDSEGRPIFIDLMRRRGPFVFVTFDCLAVNGRDVRRLPLLDRKKLLRAILPGALLCCFAPTICVDVGAIFLPKYAARISRGSPLSGGMESTTQLRCRGG